MDDPRESLIQECKRQEDSCLHTSTSLFIWLRVLRYLHAASIVLPLILSGIAGWKMLGTVDSDAIRWTAGTCALLAGLIPSVFSALKFDDHLSLCKLLAAEFKNLQDRFRQLAVTGVGKTFEQVETEFRPLADRLEKARSYSYTAPEWAFKCAQKKIRAGDYDFDVDKKD
ncbi:MAG: hypothetical protein EPO19_03335 [Betaproteobacteria bacterium]|nr:MAG: hypothetical protein EPO19_03335 [Betaproteobacteria bacterium]